MVAPYPLSVPILFPPSRFLMTLFRRQNCKRTEGGKTFSRGLRGLEDIRKPVLFFNPRNPRHKCFPFGGEFFPRYRIAIQVTVRPVIFEYRLTTIPNPDPTSATWQSAKASFSEATNVLRDKRLSLICGVYWLSSSYCKRLLAI